MQDSDQPKRDQITTEPSPTAGPDERYPGSHSRYDDEESEGVNYWFYGLIAGGVLVAAIVVWIGVGGATIQDSEGPEGQTEDPLEAVSNSLDRHGDLATCQSALNQLNSYLVRNSHKRSKPLTTAERAKLGEFFALDDDALTEIEGPNYTLLDGRHLEQCILMSDVLRALELPDLDDQSNKRELLLESVRRIFAWTVRQTRLTPLEGVALPPMYVVRVGQGSVVERGLAFLALLEQLGPAEVVSGCFVYAPDKDRELRPWACGVCLEGDPKMYLYDLRLGLPIPGPDGKGVATLAQATSDPKVLGQLTVDNSTKYDVTSEQAKKAELRMYCPLSAMAPRMNNLTGNLLEESRFRAYRDVETERAILDKAAESVKLPGKAVAWREEIGDQALPGATLLRRFLPKEEGGTDVARPLDLNGLVQLGFLHEIDPNNLPEFTIPMTRMQAFERGVVPWPEMHAPFKDPARFPLGSPLGTRIRDRFARPFLEDSIVPDGPRDQLIRGYYAKAAPPLTEQRRNAQNNLNKFQKANELEEIQASMKWLETAFELYANLTTLQRESPDSTLVNAQAKRIENHWKQADSLAILLLGKQANPLLMTSTFLLAQCKHEEAEMLQARIDRTVRPTKSERAKERANGAWRDAASWWEKFVDDYGDSPASASAKFQYARALVFLGKPAEAAAVLRDDRGYQPMQKVAAKYLASRIESMAQAEPVEEYFIDVGIEDVAPPAPRGKRVNLSGKGMPLPKVLEELTKQTGLTILDRRGTPAPNLELSLMDAPAWKAIDEVARKADAFLYIHATSGRLGLLSRRNPDEWISYHGPFRVQLHRVRTTHDFLTNTRTGHLSMQVAFEPEIAPLFLETRPQKVELRDDADNLIATGLAGSSLAPVDGRLAINFEVALPSIPRKVSRLAKYSGELDAIIPEKMLDFELPSISKLASDDTPKAEKQSTQSDVTCAVTKVTVTRTRWTVQVAVNLPKSEVELESYQSWVVNNEMVLRTKDGQSWKSDGYVLEVNSPRRAVVSYHFLTKDVRGGKPDEGAWNVSYSTPSLLQRVRIPFDFRGVPLP